MIGQIILKEKLVKKRIVKKGMTTHFARMQQLDEFPSLQRNSQYKHCHEANLHNVDILPLSWQSNIQKNINQLRENMPTYIEEEFKTKRKLLHNFTIMCE